MAFYVAKNFVYKFSHEKKLERAKIEKYAVFLKKLEPKKFYLSSGSTLSDCSQFS